MTHRHTGASFFKILLRRSLRRAGVLVWSRILAVLWPRCNVVVSSVVVLTLPTSQSACTCILRMFSNRPQLSFSSTSRRLTTLWSRSPEGYSAVAALFEKLKFPRSAFEDFVLTVQESNLLDDASVSEVLQHFVLSTISHSWFQVPGASGLCVPRTGTRPGDPLADLLFVYAVSQILLETYQELTKANCLGIIEDSPFGTTLFPSLQRSCHH